MTGGMGATTRVVIIGNGMAGSRLVDEIRRRERDHVIDRRLAVTVFGAERHGPYNRVLLSELLAGRTGVDDISLTSPAWYAEHDVDARLGVTVDHVDREAREVIDCAGNRTPYDVLVMAMGSRPWLPPVEGLLRPDGRLLPGAAVFRTVDDCHEILDLATGASRAVVLGGGLLGLEAARGLAGRGLEVEVLHRSDRLMERQLDSGAGSVLGRALQALGVQVRLTARSVRIVGDDRVRGVELADGSVVAADLLVVACGVRPETDLARDAPGRRARRRGRRPDALGDRPDRFRRGGVRAARR